MLFVLVLCIFLNPARAVRRWTSLLCVYSPLYLCFVIFKTIAWRVLSTSRNHRHFVQPGQRIETMHIRQLPSGLLALIQIALLSRTAAALVVNARSLNTLLPRDTCAGREGLSACGQDLPDNFCCTFGDACIRLNNTGAQGAALCCPNGGSCEDINVITCDTSFHDPNNFPELPLHSTDTSIALPTCGKGCCPLGYECADDGALCRIKDSAKASETVNVSPTTSAIPTAEPTSTAESPSTTSDSTPSTSASAKPTGTGVPVTIEPKETDHVNTAGLVLAGLFPGLLVGSAITLGILMWLKKRQQKRGDKSPATSSFFGPPTPHDSKPPKISEPIYQPGMSDRVVFGQNRTASGGSVPVMSTSGGFYKPEHRDDRRTADSTTLVGQSDNSNKKVRTLDPPFETPTKPGRSTRREQTKSFFSRSSSRSSRRNTQETITMTMSPPRIPSSYQNTPQARQTTYSDVYRAVGVSPSQMKSTRPSEDVPR